MTGLMGELCQPKATGNGVSLYSFILDNSAKQLRQQAMALFNTSYSMVPGGPYGLTGNQPDPSFRSTTAAINLRLSFVSIFLCIYYSDS